LAEVIEGRIANIFFIFSQAENHVKEMVAERTVLHSKYSLGKFVSLMLTITSRSLERTQAHEPRPPDHNVEVHQEFVHAVNHAGFTSKLQCHRRLN
jgi:hypothetical protein